LNREIVHKFAFRVLRHAPIERTDDAGEPARTLSTTRPDIPE